MQGQQKLDYPVVNPPRANNVGCPAATSADDSPETFKIRLVSRLQEGGVDLGSQKVVYRGRILMDGVQSADVVQPGDNDIYIGATISVSIDKKSVEWLRSHEALAKGRMAVAVMRHKNQAAKAAMMMEAQVMEKLETDTLKERNFIKLITRPVRCGVEFEDDDREAIDTFMVQEEVKPIGYDLYTFNENFKNTKRRVPNDAVRWVVHQMTNALDHIHTMGYVHRDIKPDNVLLDRNNVVKLIDFGYASTPDGVTLAPRDLRATPYLAPETNTSPRSPSIDLFGIGVIIHFLTFGMYDRFLQINTPVVIKNGEDTIQGHPCSAKALEAMRGLMKKEIDGEDARWTIPKLRTWQEEDGGLREMQNHPNVLSPWKGLVEEVFVATMPDSFPPVMLKDLRLKSMVLMIDNPSTTVPGDTVGVNILPAALTTLRPTHKIYFAVKRTADETSVVEGTLDKLGLDTIIKAARLQSDSTFYDKLVSAARDVNHDLVPFYPKFDIFTFPEHCAGAALGFDSTNSKNVLQLRTKFMIPLAAIVHADDSILWWPVATDIIQQGDQGLVMRVPEFSSAERGMVAMDLEKLDKLSTETQFRETLNMTDNQSWSVWKARNN